MKLTNKGRNIKDNSRRKGVHAARVEARRQGARDRFKVLPFVAWAKARGLGGHVDNHKAAYAAYVARKEVEAKSLQESA